MTNTITITTLPEHHATKRGMGFKISRERMIGRLTAAEFDRLDALVANLRIGIAPTLRAISLTLGIEEESASRRMYEDRLVGLVETTKADEFATLGRFVEVRAFVPSARGRELFVEALALMDRGEVAA